MEKECLIRAKHFLKSSGVTTSALITDRHRQLGKWIRENLNKTDHFFDVWHMAKSKEAKQ